MILRCVSMATWLIFLAIIIAVVILIKMSIAYLAGVKPSFEDVVILVALFFCVFLLLNWTLALSLLGIAIALGFPVFIEMIQRPSLEIEPLPKEDTVWRVSGERFYALRLNAKHRPLPTGWKRLYADRWLERRPAIGCHGSIEFLDVDGHSLHSEVNEGQMMPPMQIRWADSPQPTEPQAFIRLPQMQIRWADSSKPTEPQTFRVEPPMGHLLRIESAVDIAPGQNNRLDLVMRHKDDPCCYGWNNENYFLPDISSSAPRNEKWKLPTGKYKVVVNIIFSDRSIKKHFYLHNTEELDGVKLEPLD